LELYGDEAGLSRRRKSDLPIFSEFFGQKSGIAGGLASFVLTNIVNLSGVSGQIVWTSSGRHFWFPRSICKYGYRLPWGRNGIWRRKRVIRLGPSRRIGEDTASGMAGCIRM